MLFDERWQPYCTYTTILMQRFPKIYVDVFECVLLQIPETAFITMKIACCCKNRNTFNLNFKSTEATEISRENAAHPHPFIITFDRYIAHAMNKISTFFGVVVVVMPFLCRINRSMLLVFTVRFHCTLHRLALYLHFAIYRLAILLVHFGTQLLPSLIFNLEISTETSFYLEIFELNSSPMSTNKLNFPWFLFCYSDFSFFFWLISVCRLMV